MQDTVGIDIEGHFDLRHATRRRRNVFQVELTQRLVLPGLLTLTLQHMHGYRRLVVVRGGEHLRRIGRDGGVLLDQRSHHATHGFDTQGQRRHVQQQYVSYIAAQYRTLNGRTHGNRFIRVHVLARLFAEELGHFLLHHRHTGLTTHQDHIGDLGTAHTGVFQRGLARLQGTGHQIAHQ